MPLAVSEKCNLSLDGEGNTVNGLSFSIGPPVISENVTSWLVQLNVRTTKKDVGEFRVRDGKLTFLWGKFVTPKEAAQFSNSVLLVKKGRTLARFNDTR